MVSYPHWDYFLTLEADLSVVARYIEFSRDNFGTYSIELARIIVESLGRTGDFV
jgi:hypothetical protein